MINDENCASGMHKLEREPEAFDAIWKGVVVKSVGDQVLPDVLQQSIEVFVGVALSLIKRRWGDRAELWRCSGGAFKKVKQVLQAQTLKEKKYKQMSKFDMEKVWICRAN
jgi:hypothetical protein